MKTSQAVLMLVLGIVVGYLIRMAVHKSDYVQKHEHVHHYETKDDKGVLPPSDIPQSIDPKTAERIVKGYTGKNKYFYISDKLLDQLIWLRNKHNSDGSAVFLAKTDESREPSDTIYDAAVIVRTEDDHTEADYYEVKTDHGEVGMCPYICDVQSPF